jgi:hypothetical protein
VEEEREEWKEPDGTTERRWGRMGFMELRAIGVSRASPRRLIWAYLFLFISWASFGMLTSSIISH